VNYDLTLRAELDHITDDVAETSGLERALEVCDRFYERAELIAQSPKAHREYPEAPRQGLASAHGEHGTTSTIGLPTRASLWSACCLRGWTREGY